MNTLTEGKNINKNSHANKGGRPKKPEHLDQKLTVMCTRFDVIAIRYYEGIWSNSIRILQSVRT